MAEEDIETPNAYYQRLAKFNVCDGIQVEPRLWWNEFVFEAGAGPRVYAPDNVFYNGDEYPVRITHILAAMRPRQTDESPAPSVLQGDERRIQRYGLLVETHDTFYQNSLHVPLPLWHNVCSAGMQAVAPGYASVRFQKTFPLAQRQSWVIEVQLETTPDEARTVGITFHGVGRISKRPYLFNGQINLSTTTSGNIDPFELRSQGGEPVDIWGMSLFCSAIEGANDAAGDIRQLRVSIRSTGNGTQQNWESGPIPAAGPEPIAPAVLWGATTGRAIVHALPQTGPDVYGWLVQPGQGFTLSLLNYDTTHQATIEEAVWLAFYGYVIIT